MTDVRRLATPARPRRQRRALVEPARFIAHDVNNLLTAIAGAAELILARGPDPAALDPATLEDARAIQADAERCACLVRLLIAPASRLPSAPRPIPLNPAIERLEALLRRLLGSRIRLELMLGEPGPTARIDPIGLDRVLINLTVNARNAMPEGGTLRLRSGAVTLGQPLVQGEETIPKTPPPGRYARIEVADDGCGIAPEILPRIFEPHFTTRGDRGLGLGLAAARGIVRRAGGWIAVESTPGRGTCFRIDLPFHAGDEALARPPPSRAPSAIPSGSLALLVEDETAVGRVVLLALRKAGWEVHLAGSAASVIADLDRLARPDVLVSDVAMPGMDGPDLVRRLRERWPGLPAILVSGYVEEEARRRLEAEEMRFLPKPYSLASLLSAMAAAAGLMAAPGT